MITIGQNGSVFSMDAQTGKSPLPLGLNRRGSRVTGDSF